MSAADFVRRFGGIYENSPWVAERAARHIGRAADFDQIATLMADVVDNASRERQLDLIRAHPDLADRLKPASELTQASADEQASAGLDALTPAQYERFSALNAQYRKRFGFPFVMAVRGAAVEDILAAFDRRLGNDRETEIETALEQIHEIARMRLEAIGLGD